MLPPTNQSLRLTVALLLCCAMLVGCGTSLSRSGTEQLLASDAVDRAISNLDFRVLSGKTVFFDTQFVSGVKTVGFVNAPYIISSVRQQLSAAGCKLQDSRDSADYVVEARVGALGTDLHEVTYGLPASNALSAAASVISSVPAVPTIPEVSLANRNDQTATAKIAVFAYHRETRLPVWQSGIQTARSSAKDTWLLGAGPIQRGSIYDGVRFAGNRLRIPFFGSDRDNSPGLPENYAATHQFAEPDSLERELAEAKRVAEEARALAAKAAEEAKALAAASAPKEAGATADDKKVEPSGVATTTPPPTKPEPASAPPELRPTPKQTSGSGIRQASHEEPGKTTVPWGDK